MVQPFVTCLSLPAERVTAEHPFTIAAVRALDGVRLAEVTYFVGENGSGKSTIVEGIAVAAGFNAEGGTRNFSFATRPSECLLGERLRLVRSARLPRTGFFLRAESLFNVASEIERLDAIPAPAPPIIASYGSRSLHEQSHGESFLALVNHRFGNHGLYLLDEPEAALSPGRQLSLLRRIHELVLNGSQFIIATHSPIVLAYPGALIYRVDHDGLSRVAYEEVEQVTLTRDFLNHPDAYLAKLLGDA